jgi:hypothetical protein
MIADYKDSSNAIDMYLRNDDIRKADDDMLDIYDVMKGFPKVNYRYYVAPTQKMPSGLDIIKTDNATITWPM